MPEPNLQRHVEFYDNPSIGRQESVVPRRRTAVRGGRAGGGSGAAWDDRASYMRHRREATTLRPESVPPNGDQEKHFLRCVCAYLTGYMGDKVRDLELKQLIVAHGGRVVPFFAKEEVTHLIATTLTASKLHQLLDSNTKGRGQYKVHLVKPDWVLECVERGRRVDESAYGLMPSAHGSSMPAIRSAQPSVRSFFQKK